MKLRIYIDDFSDKYIFRLANLGCYGAFCHFAIRARKKKSLERLLSILDQHMRLQMIHPVDFKGLHSTEFNFFNSEVVKLLKFHSKIYSIPLRFFVSPLNTNRLNKILLQIPLEKTLDKFVYQLNNSKKLKHISINGFKLSQSEITALKLTIVWMNWYLIRSAYRRPPSKILEFLFSPIDVQHFQSLPEKKLNSKINLTNNDLAILLSDKSVGLDFIRLTSIQYFKVWNSISNSKKSTLARLIYKVENLGAVSIETLNFLPIFSLLDITNYDNCFPLIKKFNDLGYTRIIHSKVFRKELHAIYENEAFLNRLVRRLVA